MAKKVRWVVEVDSKTGQASLKNFSSSIKKTTRKMQDQRAQMKRNTAGLDVMKNALMAIGGTAVIYGLSRLTKQFIELSAVQEKAEVSVKAALMAYNEYTEAAMKSNLEFASSIQKVLTYGDEEVLMLAAQIKSLGVSGARLQEATRMAIGLAEATGRSADSMAMYIAMAEQGEFTMLRRYIPALRSTNDATEQMKILQDFANKGFEIGIEKTKTYSGKVKQLSNVKGDLYEKIGDVITKNKALLKLMDDGKATLEGWVGDLGNWVEVNRDLIDQRTEDAIYKITTSIEGIVHVYNSLPEGVVGAAGGGIIARILTGSSPIGWAVSGLMLLNTHLEKMGVHLDDIIKKSSIGAIRAMGFLGYQTEGLTVGGSAGEISGAGRGWEEVPKTEERTEEKKEKAQTEIEELWEIENEGYFARLESYRFFEQQKMEMRLEAANAEIMGFAMITQASIDAEKKKAEIDKMMKAQMLGNAMYFFKQMGTQSILAFRAFQALAIGEAMVETYKSTVAAWSWGWTYGGPFAPAVATAAAALALARGVATVHQIASSKPPSYDEGGISTKPEYYYAGVPEAHIPLKGGSVPVSFSGGTKGGDIYIVMNNPTFQDLETQRQSMAEIAYEVTTLAAPDAVVKNYYDDGPVRRMVQGGG